MAKTADSNAAVRVDPGAANAASDAGTARTHQSAFGLFQTALREHPVRSGLGLGVEYATFAAGLGLAGALFATRVPLRVLDRTLGLRTRDRFIELLARLSPG